MGFWSRLRHHLFDQPISRPELERLLRLLPVAVAETGTQRGFEEMMRFVLTHLEQYRRLFESEAMPRTLAQRLLADPPLAQGERTGFEPPAA